MNYKALCTRVLDASLRVKHGERVWINGWDHTIDLISALSQEARRRGCEVVPTIRDEEAWVRSLRTDPEVSLNRLSSRESILLNESDLYIFTLGPRHPVNWAEIPPERRKLATIWLLEQNKFVREWMSIAKKRRVKMLGIEATLATEERAKALGVNHRIWRQVMYSGCLADCGDLAMKAKNLSRYLTGDAELRILSPGGTDLTFRLDNRKLELSDGLASERKAGEGTVTFLPAGAVGTTIDERSAEGRAVYDNPIRSPMGLVENLTFELKSGRIVDYSASSGLGGVEQYLENTKGDADRFAFFGIGLNPNLRPGYTQDDKVLGSVELNFGANRSRGGKNRGDSNWWGTLNNATVIAGRRKIMAGGRLLV